MRAQVYKQAYEPVIREIVIADFSSPYAKMTCYDCEGKGTFELPDERLVPCVPCKGRGYAWINLY